jgi:mRNA interferase MazF
LKQYEIWWAELPAPAGRRPVLLLSRGDAYEVLNKYIAVEITTTIREIAVEVPLNGIEGLDRPCVANFDNPRTISKAHLSQKIGALGPVRIPEVKRALGYALRWDELLDVNRSFMPSSAPSPR